MQIAVSSLPRGRVESWESNDSMNAPLNASAKSLPPIAAQDLDYILEKTERLWPEMRDQRVFITGGTGFFGRWLLESFLAANHRFALHARAAVLTRSPDLFRARCPRLAGSSSVELIAGDVREFSFPAGPFPFVIHAATDSILQQRNGPADLLSTIVDGTRRCLEFAESHGTRKFLLTSSGAVYGPQPPEITHISEDYRDMPNPGDANSVYGEGKRMAELLCALTAARSGLECKIARCFAFVGPHLPLDAHFAIGNFIRDVLHGGPIQIQGDGTPHRSYLYAADLAVWLWTMLFEAPSMRPFNVGSDRDMSIHEIAEAVANAIHPDVEVRISKSPQPDVPVHRYVPNVDRARDEMKLTQGIFLADAIQRTAAWHRAELGAQIADLERL
jgi:nucleoside-diphosphate-sugar epimerase